jgi:hypothetical protein
VVGFYHREDQKPFEELKAIWKETLAKPEVCDQLRTSAISRAREIREAAQVFKMAIVEASSDSRAGDQYGALAAGYWLLTNDTMPTPEDAKAWAETIPWKRKGDTTKADDSVQCLNTLLEQVVSFSDDSGDRSVRRDRTIGELLESCRQNLPEKGVCKEVLRRYGIDPKTDRKHFDVAKKHAGLAKLMEKTRFNDGRWTQFLAHLPGADADNIRISLYKQRSIPSVRVPYSAIQHEWSDE